MTHALGLTAAALTDPDAQSTVTDFVDYTEYYPSDLFRSLTLIGQLDQTYQEQVANVHGATKAYGSLPSLPAEDRPDPFALRKDISIALERALQCRESSYAEATRLHNLTESLYKRIQTIRSKLEAQPKPPSREATPSPQANRARRGEPDRHSRLKSTQDGHKKSIHRPAGLFSRRRLIIPGEVLPPRDPNSPSPSVTSDTEPERAPTPVIHIAPSARGDRGRPPKEKTPRPPQRDRTSLPKPPKIRGPGVMGTNAHSSVAGISVSNAIAQLVPPPENPLPGSKHAPWLQLTEWELNTIRKRMKKNADWMPSDIMLRRELKAKGRGLENYENARKAAEEDGEEFLDEQPETFVRPVQYRNSTSEPRFAAQDEQSLVNRGMKLNEAKKLKRQQMLLDQQALAASESGEPSKPTEELASAANASSKKDKKRKRESEVVTLEMPSDTASVSGSKATVKKIKLNPLGRTSMEEETGSMTDELGADMPNPSQALPRSAPKGLSQQETVPIVKRSHKKGAGARALAASTGTATPAVDAIAGLESNTSNAEEIISTIPKTRSRGSSTMKLKLPQTKAASAEPEAERPRISIRRTSDGGPAERKLKLSIAKNAAQSTETAASRRGKRAAPGMLASHADEPGSKVSIAKRKTATSTTTKRSSSRRGSGTEGALPTIDDDEEADGPWCICGNSSYGRMVACSNEPECPIQWFHVGCVGLEDIEKTMRLRRQEWYCPECRPKFGVGGNGIVSISKP